MMIDPNPKKRCPTPAGSVFWVYDIERGKKSLSDVSAKTALMD